ncbi:phycobilisome protein [Synechococcales cyanobacterium C]|uniref:Phycobilisome protein n=1 Tax=Petrachloros mirabilis ULC683 TaxID=2781853 RepID=A0A8K2A8Y2_9CYAN|nr:phycobilisome protein [Petrachloros mirabilis]NCJ07674.1 phycobilisome protein [Petrachloros mirabilis ULC683]
MYTDLEALLYQAENHYLTPSDLQTFRGVATELQQRLALYEKLRELESDLFEALALQLQSACADASPAHLTQVLQHWILAFRYSAMAMLLNQPQFLQRRLLEWLTDIVQVHQMGAVETTASNLLLTLLVNRLSPEQIDLVRPYLDQARTTLLHPEVADLGTLEEVRA